MQYGDRVETQVKLQVGAVHARFALSFPILFFLSLGAHVIGGGGLPTVAGLFAGAVFSALFSALVSRSTLTVVRVSIAALASQLMVHLAFHYVHSLGVRSLGGHAGGGHAGGHHLHGGSAVDLTTVVAVSDHAMFTVPMLAAHLVAGVAVAVVLVQVDQFLAYLRSAAKSLISVLSPVVLIAPRVKARANFFPTTVGIHVFLAVLTKRGPPRSLKFLSI